MLLLTTWLTLAFAGDGVTCKHGFPGFTVLAWQGAESLRLAELERAQRAGRAVDPVPEHGLVTAEIHRRPAQHAQGENFSWVFLSVDGREITRIRADETVPRPPPPPRNNRDWPWRTDNRLEVPAGLPPVFEVHLVDGLLDDSCAIRVDGIKGKVKKTRPIRD